MQFQLPQNLKQALVAYDPQLKKLAQEQQAKAKPKKNPNSLGVFDLKIPHDVISPSSLETVMKEINTRPTNKRYYRYEDTEKNFSLIIFNVRNIWHAAWTPPRGSHYLYGYAFAFNANESTYNKLEGYLITYSDNNDPSIKVGRKFFYVHSHCVTIQDVVNNVHQCRDYFIHTPELDYRNFNYEYRKSISYIEKTIYESLKYKNLIWKTNKHWHEKIVAMHEGIVYYVAKHEGHDPLTLKGKMQKQNDKCYDFTPKSEINADILLYMIKFRFRYQKENKSFMDKPFFKKWLAEIADHINKTMYSSDKLENVFAPFHRAKNFVHFCLLIETIWPDTPIDYYQENKELFYSIETYFRTLIQNETTFKWMRENMSAKTFINLVAKEYNKAYQKHLSGSYAYLDIDSKTQCFAFCPAMIKDTLDMTLDILNEKAELKPPKRWRDWHDHVMSAHWKLNHPCVTLPQDLFPEPIHQDGYCFFQPINTHQLADWGRAVRNCVGSSGYATLIKKKKCFIVLAMLNNQPTFTVQLKHQNGMLIVDQIVGLGNARLSDEEKEVYQKTFASALQKRSEQLS